MTGSRAGAGSITPVNNWRCAHSCQRQLHPRRLTSAAPGRSHPQVKGIMQCDWTPGRSTRPGVETTVDNEGVPWTARALPGISRRPTLVNSLHDLPSRTGVRFPAAPPEARGHSIPPQLHCPASVQAAGSRMHTAMAVRDAGDPEAGLMAQLVAHLLCKQGVRGSIPRGSTIDRLQATPTPVVKPKSEREIGSGRSRLRHLAAPGQPRREVLGIAGLAKWQTHWP